MKRTSLSIAITVISLTFISGCGKESDEQESNKRRPTPSISTTKINPTTMVFSDSIKADGPIAPWQEVIVSNQSNGLPVTEVLVQIGDYVKKGQVLAKMDNRSTVLEYQQLKAALKEAQVHLIEAKKKAGGARSIGKSGALSDIEQSSYANAESIAAAQLDSAVAQLEVAQLKLDNTLVTAPTEGLVISKNAVLGAIHPLGQEMFKLIRENRIEWRAELTPDDLNRISKGQSIEIKSNGQPSVHGHVRLITPSLDEQTRRGMIYADLTSASGKVLTGSYVTGEIKIGDHPSLGFPAKAVCIKNNASYVFEILPSDDDIHPVRQIAVTSGVIQDNWMEIRSELPPDAQFVADGPCFLDDKDYVRVVER